MGEIPRTSDVSRPEEIVSVVDATPLNEASHREENNVRVKMLDQIVACLETKKPSWQKARILHLSTQLEASMFNSKESLAEYGDASTLPAKINRHCLLLATRKTTTDQAPAPGTAGGVRSFPATPISRGTPAFRTSYVNIPATGPVSISGGGLRPPSDSGRFSQPAPRDPAAGGAAAPHSLALASTCIGAGHKLSVGAGGGAWGGAGHDGARELRSVSGGGSNGETTEDDMNYDSLGDDVDDDGDGDDKREQLHEAAPRAATLSRTRTTSSAASMAPPPPPPAAAAADTRVQREQEGGEGQEEEEEEEEEVTEQARVEAVIAAASASLGEDTAWNGGVREGAPAVRQLLEGGHQPQSQRHPKATEAEVRQHALRLLQCRLLLLTHASTCSKDGGSCQLAPLCDSVRQLLRHLQSCRDEKSCEFPHCKSSKAVLQHKRLCTDSACRLCGSVKDLSQKCFWANARHLHKRRLEESHELRRKKRQSEGKAVAPPRRLQAEKAKGREHCSGLDEAGNDLGDISLGFFLRQAKAVKARKTGKAQESSGDDGTTTSAKPSSAVAFPSPANADPTPTPTPTPAAGSKRGHDGVARGEGPALEETGPSPPTAAGRAQRQTRGETAAAAAAATPTSLGLASSSAASAFPAFPSPVSSPRLRRSSSSSVSWSALLTRQLSPPRGGRSPRAQDPVVMGVMEMEMHAPGAQGAATATATAKAVAVAVDAEDVSGGGPETRSVGASSGGNGGGGGGGGGQQGGKKAAERAGGLTVVIPPASGAVVGHLRSPSEIMLDDIAESLADTTRKPSFARMQSVQAFLDDHVELRASASFGDVSAMVEHWMSLEDSNDAANLEDENGMAAFSF